MSVKLLFCSLCRSNTSRFVVDVAGPVQLQLCAGEGLYAHLEAAVVGLPHLSHVLLAQLPQPARRRQRWLRLWWTQRLVYEGHFRIDQLQLTDVVSCYCRGQVPS